MYLTNRHINTPASVLERRVVPSNGLIWRALFPLFTNSSAQSAQAKHSELVIDFRDRVFAIPLHFFLLGSECARGANLCVYVLSLSLSPGVLSPRV